MSEGKRSFLEQSDWLAIPWECDQKPRIQKLLDIACMIPGLMEDRYKLSVLKQSLAKKVANDHHQPQPVLEEAYHSVASSLARQCEQCLHQLRIWKTEWELEGEIFDLSTTTSAPPAGSAYPHTALGPPLTFCNLRQANQYTMYHALLSLFLTVTYEVKYEASPLSTDIQSNAINASLFLEPGLATPFTDHDHLLAERHRCVIEICRSAPYHQVTGIRGCGIMFPLLAARQRVDPDGEEARYIDSVLPCATGTRGFGSLEGISPGARLVSLITVRHTPCGDILFTISPGERRCIYHHSSKTALFSPFPRHAVYQLIFSITLSFLTFELF